VARFRRWLILFVIAGMSCLVNAKQLAVVTNTSNSASDLTTAELVKIFNARTQAWPDGRPIKLVVRDPLSAEMQLVVRRLLAMTPEQAQAFVQSHKRMIIVADTDDTVIKVVSNTRGAIGVVDLFSLTKDVKVLKIDGKLPVEQGYVLRGN
jgi:ABC-type phosphate transport system substrate-binding protein